MGQIVGIIPARGGSKGIPRKNIKFINGMPLIKYSIKAAQESRKLDSFYISTEDQEIKEIAISFGASVIDRPFELAGDNTSTFAVLQHAWQVLGSEIEAIVCLQPTSPLRSATHIDDAISLLTPEINTVIGVCRDKRYCWEIKSDETALALFDERKPRQMMKPRYAENGSIYVCRTNVFENNDDKLGMGISSTGKRKLFEMSEEHSIEIDSMFDFKYIELLLKEGL